MTALELEGTEPYLSAARTLLEESGSAIARYVSDEGAAWLEDGVLWIEVPRPVDLVTFAMFAHECAHNVLHRKGRKAIWLKECEAWAAAFAACDRFGFNGQDEALREYVSGKLAGVVEDAYDAGAKGMERLDDFGWADLRADFCQPVVCSGGGWTIRGPLTDDG